MVTGKGEVGQQEDATGLVVKWPMTEAAMPAFGSLVAYVTCAHATNKDSNDPPEFSFEPVSEVLVLSEFAKRLECQLHKLPGLDRILLARLRLHSAGDIDAIATSCIDRFPNIVRS